MPNNKEQTKTKRLSTKQKVLIGLLASITGIGATNVTAALIAHESVFSRYNRPDYSVTPGICCYERISDKLERETLQVKSGGNQLQAYFFPNEKNKGLILLVHGKHGSADDLLPLIEGLHAGGYNVFAYDGTGTFESDGDSLVGACQPLIDVNNVLSFIQSEERFSGIPLFLCGYSMGGYAVTSVLELKQNVKACAAIAPVMNAPNLMVDSIDKYAGKVSYVPKPLFDAHNKMLFKDFVKYNGVRGINSTNIPILIAQGMCDSVVSHDKISVYAHKDKITNPNVSYYETYGLQGEHVSILYSIPAIAYQNEIKNKLNILKTQKGKDLTNDDLVEFNNSVNHALYSEINPELVAKILALFNSSL